MKHKYVRHSALGFIIWPMTHDIYHSHIGEMMRANSHGHLISAGFADFSCGTVKCYGLSESLRLASKPEDSRLLAKQLGIVHVDSESVAGVTP